jgi:hypothetical protein
MAYAGLKAVLAITALETQSALPVLSAAHAARHELNSRA